MKSDNNGASGNVQKVERKTVERDRRLKMKNLCIRLASLIPDDKKTSAKDGDRRYINLDGVVSYINTMKEKIERLKIEKEIAVRNLTIVDHEDNSEGAIEEGLTLPVVEVRLNGANLEVVLISGQQKSFSFHEVIAILEEEGAVVFNANYSTIGDKSFFVTHSRVDSTSAVDSSRLRRRLLQLLM